MRRSKKEGASKGVPEELRAQLARLSLFSGVFTGKF